MSETTPPTGAVGSTGATSGGAPTVPSGSGGTTPPKHPTQVPNPNAAPPTSKAPPASLSETEEGAQLIRAYDVLRDTFQSTLPDLIAQLSGLAHRPIGG